MNFDKLYGLIKAIKSKQNQFQLITEKNRLSYKFPIKVHLFFCMKTMVINNSQVFSGYFMGSYFCIVADIPDKS